MAEHKGQVPSSIRNWNASLWFIRLLIMILQDALVKGLNDEGPFQRLRAVSARFLVFLTFPGRRAALSTLLSRLPFVPCPSSSDLLRH